MAFRRLQDFNPVSMGIEPRVDSEYAINSNYCVLGASSYPTLKETIENGFSSNIRLIGLIGNYNLNEAINFNSVFEIGNSKSITIPGKFRGSMQLSSGMIESVNLLGSIAESIVEGFARKYRDYFKGINEEGVDFFDEVLFRPKLNETYFSDEKKVGSLNPSGNNELLDYYGIGDEYDPSVASEASSIPETTDKGAISLSLDDIRLRIKFGLCFIIFQRETRLPENTLKDYGTFQAYDTTALENLSEITGQLINSTLNPINYKIMAGQFYENCFLNSYSRALNSNALGGNYNESVSLIYNGTRKLKKNMAQKIDAFVKVTSTPA